MILALRYFLIVVSIGTTIHVQSVAAQSRGYWYSGSIEADLTWSVGRLVSVSDSSFDIIKVDNTIETISLAGRCPSDYLRLSAFRELNVAANRLKNSTDYPNSNELIRLKTRLLEIGVDRTSAAILTGVSTLRQGSEIETPSSYRWISINGMDFKIASVQSESEVPGYTNLWVKDRVGRRLFVDPAKIESVLVLPSFWNQPISAFHSKTGADLSFQRGSVVLTGHKLEKLIAKDLPGEGPDRRYWTTELLEKTGEHLAVAREHIDQAEREAIPFHAQRHRIQGDRYIVANQYDRAMAEYQASLMFEPNNSATLLRRGFVLVLLGETEVGLRDLENCLDLSKGNAAVVFAASELLARYYLHRAIAEKDDVAAKKFHDTAVRFAKAQPDGLPLGSFAVHIPPPILNRLLSYREQFRVSSLPRHVENSRNMDLSKRADHLIGKGVTLFESGSYDSAIQAAQGAKLIFGEDEFILLASSIIEMRAQSRLASKELVFETAALRYADLLSQSTQMEIKIAALSELRPSDHEFIVWHRAVVSDWTKSVSKETTPWTFENELADFAFRDLRYRSVAEADWLSSEFVVLQKSIPDKPKESNVQTCEVIIKDLESLSERCKRMIQRASRLMEWNALTGQFTAGRDWISLTDIVIVEATFSARDSRDLQDAIGRITWLYEDFVSRLHERNGNYVASVKYAARSYARKTGVPVKLN
jgi:tetratricopeptide (TPR) repeat protein